MHKDHGGQMPAQPWWCWLLLLVLLAGLYLLAVRAGRNRQRAWPELRTVGWFAGLGVVALGTIGPIAGRAHSDFRLHMLAHLLIGMLAPLLLVSAMPVTAALRALPTSRAKTLVQLLRSRPVRVLVHPLTAAILDMGGLWLLYTTGLYGAMHRHSWLGVAVHLHLLAAGYLFTAAMIGRDPMSHRPGRALRAVTLVLALTAHAILAKHLYRHPPAGVPLEQAQEGSLLMYYGGDAVDLLLLVAFCRQWLAADRRAQAAAMSDGDGYGTLDAAQRVPLPGWRNWQTRQT